MPKQKILVVIAGPTAVGKTSFAIELAQRFQTHIISFDSRQFYGDMHIGTASPSKEELDAAPHHFIGHLKLDDYYNVSIFEQQALAKLDELFKDHSLVIAVGGSGLYINALCHGIDDLPDADMEARRKLNLEIEQKGMDWLRNEVKKIDPEYFATVDQNNPKRLMRAVEIWRSTGKTFSSLRTQDKKERDFKILKLALNLPREELFSRINNRVDQMIAAGLEQEAYELLKYRHLNALNTVGYKELFNYFDGIFSLEEAIEKIKTNTRRYAKRQITWFKKDPEFQWISPPNMEEATRIIQQSISHE